MPRAAFLSVVNAGGEVARAGVGKDAHDVPGGFARASEVLGGGEQRRAGGDAAQETLAAREELRGGEGVLVGHGKDLVDQRAIQNRRNEVRADALQAVRPNVPFESRGEDAGSTAMTRTSGQTRFR